MKRILIHSPYWEAQSGGERYALTLAGCLQDQARVVVTIPSQERLRQIKDRLGLSLKSVSVLGRMLSVKSLVGFSAIFWVSDGSIPFLPVARRVIHFQSPFVGVGGNSLRNRIKLLRASIICNSFFTKRYIDREYSVNSSVIYPPVEIEKFHPRNKENLILSVGRFSTGSQHKRPDSLVRAFKSLVDGGLSGWRLVIAGTLEDERSDDLVRELRISVRGYPIVIKTDVPHDRIIYLYERARLYWHAAGFGADLKTHPERAEHFGISTVEAMAAGAVPCSFAAGGQTEIITPGVDGILWETLPQLVRETRQLISQSEKMAEMSQAAVASSQAFSSRRFCREVRPLFF